jgi:hypothetical protein
MTVKKIFGFGVKMLLAAVVILFMGLQSLNFFTFVFPADQWYYAYLGFGLTSGAVIGYLIIFATDSDSPLKKVIAMSMMAISLLGELATAGYGMQLEAQIKSGLVLTQTDYDFMILAVKLLGMAHGIALIAYFAGDKIVEAMGDADGDGIPNILDKDYIEYKKNNKQNQPQTRPQMRPVPMQQTAPKVEEKHDDSPQ